MRSLAKTTEAFDHGQLELAKWVAIATMAVDHYGKIVEPSLYEPTHAAGRVSFPLFAAIVAFRLAFSPHLAAGYLKRLLPWAIISQPAYVVAGRAWHEGNILFTLALGVTLVVALEQLRAGLKGPGLLLVLIALAASPLVEFGVLGVLMIPAVTVAAQDHGNLAVWAVGPLGLLANLRLAAPFLSLLDVPALASPFVMLASSAAQGRVPRLPKYVFYVFYPGHLLLLHWVDLYVVR